MFDQGNILYLISLSILTTVCWIMYGYYREKLHIYHFWELRVNLFFLCPLSLITVCNHTSNQNTKMVDRTVVGGN